MSQLCVEIRKKRSVWRMQENDDAYFIWYEAYRCCQRPKKPKKRKKEPLYFIVDEFNVYHKMLNEFAVVVCSHFGWVCCCCLQAESAHINCNKKNSAFCFVHHQPRRRRLKIQHKDNHGNHRNEFRSFSF